MSLKHLQVIAEYQQLPASLVKLFASSLLTVASNPPVSDQVLEAIKTLLSILRERRSTIVDSAYLDVSSRLAVPVDLLNSSSESGALFSIYSADISARVQGIKDLFSDLTLEDSDRETAKEAIRARVADQDPAVLDAIYGQAETLGELLTPKEIVDALRPVFVGNQVKAAVLSRHVKFLCGSLVARQPELEDRVFQQLLFHVMLPSSERRGLSRADWESIAALPVKGSDILRKVAQDIIKAEIGALDKDTAPEVYRFVADSLSSKSPHPGHAWLLIFLRRSNRRFDRLPVPRLLPPRPTVVDSRLFAPSRACCPFPDGADTAWGTSIEIGQPSTPCSLCAPSHCPNQRRRGRVRAFGRVLPQICLDQAFFAQDRIQGGYRAGRLSQQSCEDPRHRR